MNKALGLAFSLSRAARSMVLPSYFVGKPLFHDGIKLPGHADQAFAVAAVADEGLRAAYEAGVFLVPFDEVADVGNGR